MGSPPWSYLASVFCLFGLNNLSLISVKLKKKNIVTTQLLQSRFLVNVYSITARRDFSYETSFKSQSCWHCVKSVRIRSYSGQHFPGIRTEYGEIWNISLYSVQMREIADQNNSEYRHFL